MAPKPHDQRSSCREKCLRPEILARRRRYPIRDPEGRSGRCRPKELRHGHRAMAVAGYQKPELELDQFSHSIPQFGNYQLFEPRVSLHPNTAAPTWMRQWKELITVP